MKRPILLMTVLLLLFSTCKKDSDDNSDNGGSTQTQEWQMEINVDITDPDPSPFDITGNVNIGINGSNITFTGTYTVGNLTFENVVFYGTLSGNKVTMTTNEYQVSFESQGTTYTENISWVMGPFTVSNDSASGNGTIAAVQNPGSNTESGTFTFSTWRNE
jgi:hypothetical protein